LGSSGVCVTVEGSAGFEVLAFSDEDTKAIEDLQFVLGEGPTGDAFRGAQPVLVADVAAAGARWVQFASAASSRGVGGVYAFPLQLGGVRSGVLTVYCRTGEWLDASRLGTCLDLADSIRDYLLGALEEIEDGAYDISGSAPLRTIVYQAQGMVMVALDVSLADALSRLRALAYSEGLDINHLAADLVSGDRPMPTRDGGAE
jgi:hypothetical protein